MVKTALLVQPTHPIAVGKKGGCFGAERLSGGVILVKHGIAQFFHQAGKVFFYVGKGITTDRIGEAKRFRKGIKRLPGSSILTLAGDKYGF